MWIPKIICWKLWLERNNIIFRDERCNAARVITKFKALLGEALEANTAIKNEIDLNSEEEIWIKELVPNYKDYPMPPAIAHSTWDIRLDE